MLFLFGLYVWEHKVRLDDPSGLVATLGVPGIWGLLAVALLADGRWGAGWNGVGEPGAAGQGVTGLLARQASAAVGVGQFQVQLVGLGALFVAGWLLPWLLFKAGLWLRERIRRLNTRPAAVATAASTGSASANEVVEEPQPSDGISQDGGDIAQLG
jgi:ammonia channel protein AmtB